MTNGNGDSEETPGFIYEIIVTLVTVALALSVLLGLMWCAPNRDETGGPCRIVKFEMDPESSSDVVDVYLECDPETEDASMSGVSND